MPLHTQPWPLLLQEGAMHLKAGTPVAMTYLHDNIRLMNEDMQKRMATN
jgi:hypothetical protein